MDCSDDIKLQVEVKKIMNNDRQYKCKGKMDRKAQLIIANLKAKIEKQTKPLVSKCQFKAKKNHNTVTVGWKYYCTVLWLCLHWDWGSSTNNWSCEMDVMWPQTTTQRLFWHFLVHLFWLWLFSLKFIFSETQTKFNVHTPVLIIHRDGQTHQLKYIQRWSQP